jgi:hypothetical protein
MQLLEQLGNACLGNRRLRFCPPQFAPQAAIVFLEAAHAAMGVSSDVWVNLACSASSPAGTLSASLLRDGLVANSWASSSCTGPSASRTTGSTARRSVCTSNAGAVDEFSSVGSVADPSACARSIAFWMVVTLGRRVTAIDAGTASIRRAYC